MEKRIVREVSYRTWEEGSDEDRQYSASLLIGEQHDLENMVQTGAAGGFLEVPKDDVPLLIKVLQEFC